MSLDMSMVIIDSDIIVLEVSLGQTWCLILSLVSVWSSPMRGFTGTDLVSHT